MYASSVMSDLKVLLRILRLMRAGQRVWVVVGEKVEVL